MAPQGHALISAGLGAIIWGFTRSIPAAATTVAVGVLMDVDHLLDYFMWFWKEDTRHLWLILHGYEIAVPMFLASWLSGWNPIILAAFVGHLTHMVTDQLTNNPLPLTYFLTFRISRGFRAREVSKVKKESDLYREFLEYPGVMPLLTRLHPKFEKYRPEG